jgi:pimeloyl-ACP methyl ester carboxylesterase
MNKQNKIMKVIILIILCLVFTGCTILALEVYTQAFGRIEGDNELWNEIYQISCPREEVRFTSGDNKLQGFIYGSLNDNGLIVISHGLGGTADHYLPMIIYFVDRGWRVLAFNNTGVAGSEGESMRGLAQSVSDLEAALDFVKKSGKFEGLSVMLAGHSLGGYAVCTVLNLNRNVSAVVSLAGFNSSKEIFEEQGITMLGGLFYILSPQTWAIEKRLFGDRVKLTSVDGINKAGIPVMIVHSFDDKIIPSGTTSIYAHRNKITNQKAEIIFFEGENALGHSVYFSEEGILNIELMERINALFTNAR